MGPTRPSWIKSWMRMLDAGSLILGGCAGLRCDLCARQPSSAIQHFGGALRGVLGAVQWGPLVPGDLLADAWLLGRLGSGTPPSPSSFAPTPSLACVCTVLGGGTLGQSLLPDDAIRGHAKLAGTLVPATALTHRTGRESEQPLSTPVTAAAADWWMGGRHREWPRGLWMVDGPAACLSAPMVHAAAPPGGHGTLSCLSAAHGPRLGLAATNRQISTTSSPHRHVPPTSPPPPSTNPTSRHSLTTTLLFLTRPPSSAPLTLTLHPSPSTTTSTP